MDAYGAQVTGGPPELGPDLDGAALAGALGLAAADLDPALPAGVAAAGVPFAFLPVRPDAVARAVPDPPALRRLSSGLVGVAVFAFDRPDWRAHLRMFAPEVGVVEDPATGSAAVALGVFLTARGVLAADGQTGFTVAQGAEIGRPSPARGAGARGGRCGRAHRGVRHGGRGGPRRADRVAGSGAPGLRHRRARSAG